jgi:hypothetical protein
MAGEKTDYTVKLEQEINMLRRTIDDMRRNARDAKPVTPPPG